MNIIAILNQKGGTGKTTLSTHLARALQLQGKDILLVDSDPQGSAGDWAVVNENQTVPVVSIDRPTLDRDLKNISKKDFVIIDGAPHANEMIVSSLKVSNGVIIPVQPSPYDIWATSDLVDLVKQQIKITKSALKVAFVVSRVIKGTKIGSEIIETLEKYDLPILKTRITQRVIYPSSAAAGTTVLDQDPKGEAAQEIQNFTNEILQMFEKKY